MVQSSPGNVHSIDTQSDAPQALPPPPQAPPAGPDPNGQPRWGRRLRVAAVLIALVAAVVALRMTVFAPKPIPVDVVAVSYGTVEETVSNTRAGTVKARLRAGLSPEISGRVVEVPHREGDVVRRGDLLLQLDDSLQQARVELTVEDGRAAEARAEEACLAADLATTELGRFTELRARGISSDQLLDGLTSERDRSLAGCRAARAAVGQARAQERYVRAELALATLRAPFDGVLAEVNAEVGEWITPAPPGIMIPPVLDLIATSTLYVTAPIDEMDAARVAAGQPVRVTVDSHRGQSFTGKLVRVAPYVVDTVEQNRTVEVEAELEDPTVVTFLLPGTSADVEVILSARDGVLHIPTSAIAQGNRVLVVVDDRLEARQITTGLASWRTTEVVDGLAEGELVVTSREGPEVRAGAQVLVREEAP